MARTSSALVQGILQNDYDAGDAERPAANLQPYIDSATVIVTRVITCASQKGITLTDGSVGTETELIERWLAAHLYTKMDPTYRSRNTSKASGQFIRDKQDEEPYKDGAISLDSSGCLNSILNKKRATAIWLGKSRSQQIPYDQRN